MFFLFWTDISFFWRGEGGGKAWHLKKIYQSCAIFNILGPPCIDATFSFIPWSMKLVATSRNILASVGIHLVFQSFIHRFLFEVYFMMPKISLFTGLVFEGPVSRLEKDRNWTGPRLEKTGLQVRSFHFWDLKTAKRPVFMDRSHWLRPVFYSPIFTL